MCFVLAGCQPQNKINLTCSYFRLILISVMAETEDGIGRRLRLAGLRLTPQRYAVLDFLVRSESHPTAEQVGAGVNRRFPRASRATVYNALHTLCEAGLVQELYFEDGVARYDANVGPHHHFLCRFCGELEDVSVETVKGLAGGPVKPGYRVDEFHIMMRGVCARCAGAKARRNKRRSYGSQKHA